MLKKIKEQVKSAMKAKDSVKRDILRLVIGQVQQSGDESDDAVLKVIKKLIKSNKETMDAVSEKMLASAENGMPIISDENIRLSRENEILNTFVPQAMSADEIKAFIADNGIDLTKAKNDGQAMGMLMKPLKASGKEIDSSVVRDVIADVRS